MSWLRCSGGLAWAGAFYIGGAAGYCSVAEAKPAVDEQPEQIEESQSLPAEPVREQQVGELVEIPLDTIWAYRMPGTKSIRKLESEVYRRDGKLPPKQQVTLLRNSQIEQILKSLSEPLPKGARAQPAFAVLGTGSEALNRAADVLLEGKKPDGEFQKGSAISIIFFTRKSTVYIHLERITVREREIELQYRIVPHLSLDVTNDLAIIPLKDLPLGQYKVQILSPIVDERFKTFGLGKLNSEFVKRYIPDSFSFTVK